MSEVSTSPSSVDTTTTPADMTGYSTPPDGGEVRSIDTPQDQMQTPPQGQPQAQQPQAAAPDQAGQADQSGQQSQPGQSQPDLSKPQGQAPPPAPKPDLSQHPAVQRAGIMHTIAETLAGGPRFRESIDVNTGEMKRERVPMSRADIGMAIAMEAISGALGGLTQKGPGATGMAAEAGFQKVAAQQQQVQQQQDANATADFTRHYQVLDTNMRLYQNALTVGKMQREANDAYVSQFSDLANRIINDHPEIKKDIINYSDFGKYHVTMDSAIPYKVIPRMGADGKQVEVNGVPQSDIQYLVVDPNLKLDDFLTPSELADMKKYTIPGFNTENLPKSIPMRLGMFIGLKSKVASLKLADQNMKGYFGTASDNPTSGQPTKMPELKTPEWNNLADKAEKDNTLPAGLLRAVLQQENRQENPKAVNEKSGATGPAQFMEATAKRYHVTDRTDAKQAIPAAGEYLHDLIDKYKGDIKPALAEYNGSANPTDPSKWKTETQNYVANITKAIGLDAQPSGTSATDDPAKSFSLTAELAKDPTLAGKLEKFQKYVNDTADERGNHYQKALAAMTKAGEGDAANSLTALFGGQDKLTKYEQNIDMAYKRTQDDEAVRKADEIQQNKQKHDQDAAEEVGKMLTPPENFVLTPEMEKMSLPELRSKLESMGVTIPKDFASLYLQAHYKIAPSQFANRVWRKGDSIGMSRPDAGTFIAQFINGAYDDQKYDVIRKQRMDDTSGKNGGVLQNAATATQHMQMLLQAAKALENHDMPTWNHIANYFGVQTGNPNPTVYRALAQKVNAEVEKVAMGGNAPYKDALENGLKDISSDFNSKTIEGVVHAYTGLMAGRIGAIDRNHFDVTGEHLDNINPAVSDLFHRYDIDTPWAQRYTDNVNQTGPKPNDRSQYSKISKDGQFGIGKDGRIYVVSTGQPFGGRPGDQPQQPSPSNFSQAMKTVGSAVPIH